MPRASKEKLAELLAICDQRRRDTVLAYAAYWRAASQLPCYKPYCDAWFRLAQAGGQFFTPDRGDYTPEGREVDMGAGYVFITQAHQLPEWDGYWKAHERASEASRAFFRAAGVHDLIKAATKKKAKKTRAAKGGR